MMAQARLGSVMLGEINVLKAVFQNLAVGVVVGDLEGHVVFFSREAERILGIGAIHADLAAWFASCGCYRPDMVTLYPQEELPLARAMRGEEASDELIFVKNPQHPAGLWIEARGTPLRDSSGTVCGGFVVFSD